MKISELEQAFAMYCSDAREHEQASRIDAAWACLEAAHIIGQRVTRLHALSHCKMFALAWRTRDGRELVGQVTRILAAMIITRIWVPQGNSGRAHVAAFAQERIPNDLRIVMVAHGDGDRSVPFGDGARFS
jgi:hypothetical protein